MQFSIGFHFRLIQNYERLIQTKVGLEKNASWYKNLAIIAWHQVRLEKYELVKRVAQVE